MSHQENTNTPSYYAIIPADVRYCKDIEPGAKLLYGELTALARQEGYCWACNRYLASLYGVNNKTIQRWIGSLRDHGFISVEVEMGGFQTVRRIWISDTIKRNYTARQKCHAGAPVVVYPEDKNVLQTNTYTNTHKKEEDKEGSGEEKAPRQSRAPAASGISLDSEKREFKGVTEKDLIAWNQKFPTLNIEKELAECAEWAMTTHRSNYRKSILSWFVNVLNKREKASAKTSDLGGDPKADELLAKSIEMRIPESVRSRDVCLGYNYLEIRFGMKSEVKSFGDPGFRDWALRCLERMNLPTEGL